MKKKERAHLKEDPFINFIEKIVGKIRKFKREILFAVSICAVLAIIILIIVLFKSQSISRENQLYARALTIKNSENLDIDQKISQLKQLKNKKGISAASRLLIASLYFRKGDFKKAKETLDTFSGSELKLINDQKKLLEAEILNAINQEREAIDKLNKLLADGKSEIAKDFILLRIAKIQIGADQEKSAATNLNKLVSEFPESLYAREASTLLKILEEIP